MRWWTNAFASVATLALIAGAAAADDAQQIGPFRVGMTLDEVRAATPGVVWQDVTNEGGRVVGAQASKVWTFEGATFGADIRHKFGNAGWTLTLTSEPTQDVQKPCRNRLKSLIKSLEPTFGVFEVPYSLRTQVTGGGGVSVQRINGYPVVVGNPGTVSNVHETYSAGEDSQFAAEFEEDDTANWTAQTEPKAPKAHVKVTANFNMPVANAPDCVVEIALTAFHRPEPTETFGATLLTTFEPAFVAEFPAAEAEAAREAWKKRGGQILKAVERDLFPVPDTATFTANALAALRAKRRAEPTATKDALIDAAFAGSQLPKGAGIDIAKIERPKLPVAPTEDDAKKETLPNVSVRNVGKTVVIKVAQFKTGSYDQIANALASVKGDVIIDIRGNQGGLFGEIVHTASLFLPAGQLIAKIETRNGVETYKAPMTEQQSVDLNAVVLIDQSTNSGAILFAATLADHGRAKIAGAAPDRITGLSYGARLLDLSFKDLDAATAIRFPNGVIYRPNGAKLSDGVKPDRMTKAKGDAAIAEAAKLFAKPKT